MTLSLIKTQKKRDTAFHAAAAEGHLSVIKILIKYDVPLIEGNRRNTPLHSAAMKGSLPIIKAIYNKKPELINAVNKYGFNVLHIAVGEGNVDLVDWLLKQDKNLASQRDNNQRLPINIAGEKKKGHTNVPNMRFHGSDEENNKIIQLLKAN